MNNRNVNIASVLLYEFAIYIAAHPSSLSMSSRVADFMAAHGVAAPYNNGDGDWRSWLQEEDIPATVPTAKGEFSLDAYQRFAFRTAKPLGSIMANLEHAQFGIASEGGEIADIVKRTKIYSKPLDLDHAAEEIGDLLWYVALAATAIERNLGDIAAGNIDKLCARYPDKYTDEAALARADKAGQADDVGGAHV